MYVAITGTMGAGKSSVSHFLKEQSYSVYDFDAMVKAYYQEGRELYQYVQERYGEAVFTDKNLDFEKIAAIVFEDEKELELLESRAFSLVKKETLEIMEKHPETLIFFEVPLLFEADLASLFDYILVVDADKELRLKRLEKRGIAADDAEKRMLRQKTSEYKRQHADYVIENNHDLEDLEEEIKIFLQSLLLERGKQWVQADID